jgi:hypothetical protein
MAMTTAQVATEVAIITKSGIAADFVDFAMASYLLDEEEAAYSPKMCSRRVRPALLTNKWRTQMASRGILDYYLRANLDGSPCNYLFCA